MKLRAPTLDSIAIAFCLAVLSASTAHARTWYVLPDSTGDAPTIQAAIDSSSSGDSVIVAAGTYYVNLSIHGISNFALVSESGAEVTVLDGDPAYNPLRMQVIRLWNAPNTTIEGFTIQNGRPGQVSGGNTGGGIRIASGRVTIRGNIIKDNRNDLGGGIGFYYTCPGCGGSVVEDNQFLENVSPINGGGVCRWVGERPRPSLRDG